MKTHNDIIDKLLIEIAEEEEHEQEKVVLEDVNYEEESENNDEVLKDVNYKEESEDNDEVLEEEVIDESRNIEIDHSLIDVESIPIFESLDIRVTNIPEFPSEEFGNFMELLTK
ncbi:hypothetical protein C1646_771099 [Rhizophagus diaphanus]|nr:hypothetical protein C1646_771099 [Rhizophagus diaphanus] [Rhizophagus sp. MUCL 43196]